MSSKYNNKYKKKFRKQVNKIKMEDIIYKKGISGSSGSNKCINNNSSSSNSNSSGSSGSPKGSHTSYLHPSIYGFYHYFGVHEPPMNYNGKDYPSINRCRMWVVDTTSIGAFTDFNSITDYADNNSPTFEDVNTFSGTSINPARPYYRFIDTELNTNKFYSMIWRIRFVASDNTTSEWTWFPIEYRLPPRLNINFSASYSDVNDRFTFSNTSTGTRRVIEFNRSNYNPYSSIDNLNITQEQKDIMYDCTVRNQEIGIYNDAFDNNYNRSRFTAWNNATIII